MNVRPPRPAILSLLAVLAGCGGGGGGAGYDVTTPGSSQTYLVTPAAPGSTSSQTVQVTQASAGSFTRKVTFSNLTQYQMNTWNVSGGAEYLAASQTYDAAGTLLMTATYSPPELLLPANTSPGATASSTSTFTNGTSTYTLTRNLTVNGTESVTVPAGTYSALKVTTIVSQSNASGTVTNVAWWARGVGRVKIVNYAATGSTVNTFELTASSP